MVVEMTPQIARLVLLCLCAAFAGSIAIEVTYALKGEEPTIAKSTRNNARVAVRAAPSDSDALIAEILERPVFSPDRVPHEIEAAQEEPEQQQPPQLQSRLAGIMVGSQGREALFQEDGGEPVALKEGGQIDGFKVTAIRVTEVVLSSRFGEQVIKLEDGESGAAVTARPRAKKKPVALKVSATKPGAPAANVGKPNLQSQPPVGRPAQSQPGAGRPPQKGAK
jgi:hypothetical protein